MRLHSDVIEERIVLILNRIQAKSEKVYPENTGLLVYYDDSSTDIRPEDIYKLSDALDASRAQWERNFEAVYLVGPKAEFCVDGFR